MCGGHNILEKALFFSPAFVKVAVAVQNIHQFASNLTPLLMCLKLTLIRCEDAPLVRNSLNSQPRKIALAEHGGSPGDATPHSYCISTPTAHGGGGVIYHTAHPQERSKEVCSGSCFALVSSVYPLKVRRVRRAYWWRRDDKAEPCIGPDPEQGGNQCREENKLAWQNVWQLKANQSMSTRSHTENTPSNTWPPPPLHL